MSPHSPRFSATFWNLLPFLWAGAFALIFTSHLVLLIEGDSNDSTVLGEQQSQLTSYLRRKTGLREREREWPMGSRSSYYSDSPVQRHSTGSPAIVAVAARPSLHQRPVFPKRLYGAHLSRLIPIPHLIYVPLDLIALPPSPTSPSPTQASSAAPMLSIAKLIMHRHVRIVFFRFPFVNLAHITSRFLILFFSR